MTAKISTVLNILPSITSITRITSIKLKKDTQKLEPNIKKAQQDKLDKLDMLTQMEYIKRQVEIETQNMGFLEDDDLIEAQIYSLKSLETQYRYYVKKMKSNT